MSARAVFALLAVIVCGALAHAADEAIAVKATRVTPVAMTDKIWSALVVATNAESPKTAPAELQEFAPRLKRVFGYNQFELAGSAIQEIDDRNESWLVPSKSFWFGLRARRALSKEAQGGYLLSLQLFQDKRPLVDTEVKLAPGSPLFIRGPQYGKGQLIIVLQVQR
jgi:hypothetical protein